MSGGCSTCEETRLIYSKDLKEREHMKNGNVDGRVFYNE
jgi:hypothetical protein